MTAPAPPPIDDEAIQEVVLAVAAAILAGGTIAEVKAALLGLGGMTSAVLEKIFRRRKFSSYVTQAVKTATAALPPIELTATSKVTVDEGPSAPAPTPPEIKPDAGAGSQKVKPPAKAAPTYGKDYIPQSVLDQVNASLAKKGKHRPTPKRPPAASTFVKLKAAAQEAVARGGYLTNAARRLQAAYDTDDQAVIDAANAAEDRYEALHETAVKQRAKAVRLVSKAVVGKKPDQQGEILLGWYAHISPATCKRCLNADGKNFNALEPPPIGYPGTVHLHDHCLPGAPHDTDGRVEDVDPSTRVSAAVVLRTLTSLRLRNAPKKGQAMKPEIRTADVTEVRGPTEDAPDTKHGFTARAVQYGVADTYNTSWQRGVFKDSLEKRMPSVVWCHDWTDPVGRVVGYRDSEGGLDIDVEFDDFDAVPRARQAHAQLKSGSMSQFSFAFKRSEEIADPKLRGVTRIVKADVDEFSIVLNGSVPGTHVTSVRTADGSVDAKTAADIVTRFASGGLDLADALIELRTAGSGVAPSRTATHEFRAIGGDEGTNADPTAVLADVDKAMTAVADELNKADVEAARRYFQKAASRLSELQYLLGMVPGCVMDDEYAWRALPGTEVEVRAEIEQVADDTALLDSLTRIEQRSWMRGRGGRL